MTSFVGWSCAHTDGTIAESSGNPLSAQKSTTTGVIAVNSNRGVPSNEQIVQYASSHAFVSFDRVGAPFGRIVLMRRKGDICAVRFTEFHRKDLPSGFLTDGGPSFYAEYDWYQLRSQGVESGHREVSEKPGRGFSVTMAFTRGSPIIKCGSFAPLWLYPQSVRFFEGDERRDYEIELAPTNWREPADIDLAHPDLRWYRYDEKRQPILIPWEQLPQPTRQ